MTIRQETQYGFDFGMLRVERLAEHNGYVVVRVLNRQSGKYVEVESTPQGRNQYVRCGTIEKDALADVLADAT